VAHILPTKVQWTNSATTDHWTESRYTLFSHNHGFSGNFPTKIPGNWTLEWPTFHFHDCGKKSNYTSNKNVINYATAGTLSHLWSPEPLGQKNNPQRSWFTFWEPNTMRFRGDWTLQSSAETTTARCLGNQKDPPVTPSIFSFKQL